MLAQSQMAIAPAVTFRCFHNDEINVEAGNSEAAWVMGDIDS